MNLALPYFTLLATLHLEGRVKEMLKKRKRLINATTQSNETSHVFVEDPHYVFVSKCVN